MRNFYFTFLLSQGNFFFLLFFNNGNRVTKLKSELSDLCYINLGIVLYIRIKFPRNSTKNLNFLRKIKIIFFHFSIKKFFFFFCYCFRILKEGFFRRKQSFLVSLN